MRFPFPSAAMAICGYLVLAKPGAAPGLAGHIGALPGCDVVRVQDRDLLLLVTDTTGPDEDASLRERLEATVGVVALFLTFGDVDPDRPVRPAPRDS